MFLSQNGLKVHFLTQKVFYIKLTLMQVVSQVYRYARYE
jgi:hypothetical protein